MHESEAVSHHYETLEAIKDYYGKQLRTQADLKTSACCLTESIPPHLKSMVSRIHPEVQEKFYGCGSPIPGQLEGCTVLDLGSGSGRDCFVLSQLVGSQGRVIGLDMTSEQLEVANRYKEYHQKLFNFQQSNVEFHQGFIEDLAAVGIADESVDVVISNCVLNLSPHKKKVFTEIFRVLKPGGELYFSDVFADRRIPNELAFDPILRGECLGGALYLEDFRRLLADLGCNDFRVMSRSPLKLNEFNIEQRIGMVHFSSLTIRAFKLTLEDRCEDYGQVGYYLGTLPESPHFFDLDDHHRFYKNKPLPICSNTARMLQLSRWSPHFSIVGDESVHYGLFDCGPPSALNTQGDDVSVTRSASGVCC